MVPDRPSAGHGGDRARGARLLITPGDPRGIGPEVMARALAGGAGEGHQVTVVGSSRAFGAWNRDIVVVDPGDDAEPVEVAAIRYAVGECLAGRADALVTGPIHKARLAARGFPYPGHTEFLGALCGVSDPVMAFTGGSIRVALVTVHLSLRAVPDAVTGERVAHTVRAAHRALLTQLRLPRQRIAVCGLNPHAGDSGLLGAEERDIIAPAVDGVRAEGVDAVGPVSAETAFLLARRGEVDLVVAMYHDQGLAPLKAVDFGRSVQWTLGLPIIRTSVDHGTGDDLVGTGRADPSSAAAAIAFAAQLVGSRRDGLP